YSSLRTPKLQQCFSKCHYEKQCYSLAIVQTTLHHCNFFNRFARQANLADDTNSNVYSEIRSCQDLADTGITSTGAYEINLLGDEQRMVRCHFDSDGAWLVFQRNLDAKTNFQVGWQSYKHGFGDPQGSYWLGNEIVHKISIKTQQKIKIILKSFDGDVKEWIYAKFHI
uniref:Fibrinogen C-terminal domain-containing protein n=1 Tax=Clytia hemisphaerica TaxID=252671 RepID=A0A7M5VE21_9CNID